jgi:tetratricopeptide (TPR) repeat protein
MVEKVQRAVAQLRLAQGDGNAWGQLGRVYHAYHYFQLARRCYREAHRLDPEVADWPYLLGLDAAEQPRVEEALEYLERALELDPDYQPARFHYAEVLIVAGRLDQASRGFARLVAASPEQSWGHLGLGRVARLRNRLDEAAGHFARALELDPVNYETAYALAMTHRELGNDGEFRDLLSALDEKTKRSIDDPILNRALSEKSDLNSMILLANRLLAQGEREKAEQIYRKVLGLDPDHYDAHYNLGVLHGLQGRFEEAQRSLRTALLLQPESADAHAMLAIALLSTQRPEEAYREAKTALEINPDHARAQEILRALTQSP